MKVHGKSLTDFAKSFANYYTPLCNLEAAFIVSGLDISFDLDISSNTHRYVTITHKGGFKVSISIEGDSPAQAVKDVAEAVHL